jgi:hypothetical protein
MSDDIKHGEAEPGYRRTQFSMNFRDITIKYTYQ